MIKFVKRLLEERRRKKMLIRSAIERKKTNFVSRYLLMNYEKQTEGKVDIPAFMYAEADMKEIKRMNKLNEAYDNAKMILEESYKKKQNDIELQAERDEAMLWGV